MMRLLSTYSEPEHQIYSLCPCQDYETSSKPPAEALLFALLRATLKVAVTSTEEQLDLLQQYVHIQSYTKNLSGYLT